MFTKIAIAVAACFVALSFATVADAQRAPREQQRPVQPFTDAERNWFEIPQGRGLN